MDRSVPSQQIRINTHPRARVATKKIVISRVRSPRYAWMIRNTLPL